MPTHALGQASGCASLRIPARAAPRRRASSTHGQNLNLSPPSPFPLSQSCVRLKLITRQVINELSGGTLDVEKVTKLVPKEGFSWSDIKAALAAIAFILRQASRTGVDHAVLNQELQQLGLPKENSDGIARPFRIHADRLRAQASADSLRLPRLLSLDWRVDGILATSGLGAVRAAGVAGGAPSLAEPVLQLRLGLSHEEASPPPRISAPDLAASPLLLAARAASGAGSAAAAAAAAASAAGDAALLALGIEPLGATHVDHAHALSAGGGVSSPRAGEAGGVGLSGLGSPVAAGVAAAATAYPRATAGAFVDVARSRGQAAALLAELAAARAVVRALGGGGGVGVAAKG
jgi:hypothetical protein